MVSFVNVPGSSARSTKKDFVLLIPATVKVLLYAELEIPEVFAELVTPLISMTDPTDKLCGNSVS